MMRATWILFILLAVAALPGAAQNSSASGEAAEEPTRPRITRSSSGVTVIRGSTSQSRRSAEPEAEAPAEGAGETAEGVPPTEAEEQEKPKTRVVRSSSYRYDANGRRIANDSAAQSRRTGEEGAGQVSLENVNGRRVPYIRSEEKVISESAGGAVREQRTQRYDVAGRPTQQEVTRIEERRMPDGTVVTTSTKYVENMNGRMEPVEREITRVKESGATTTTTTVTERPAVNGGFGAIKRVESVEKRQGEERATVETTTSVGNGSGRLQLATREESTMTKQGPVATTETKKYERDAATGEMRQSERSVGRLVENADGSTTEKIETYGRETASGATNVNATRMELQEVVERRTTESADGAVRERTSVRSRDVAESSRMSAATVTEKVSRPGADGETVRTDFYEQSVNGRMRPAGTTIEEIKN